MQAGRQAGRGRWRACRSGVAKHLPSSFNLLHQGMGYNVALATLIKTGISLGLVAVLAKWRNSYTPTASRAYI